MERTSGDWQDAATAITFSGQSVIDGKSVDGLSGKTFASKSPIDGRHLPDVALCDAGDVDRAVASGRRAFEAGVWSGTTPADRKRVMRCLADLIRTQRDEVALLETLDMGKPIGDSTSIDVRAVANCFDYYGAAIDKIYDEIAPTARNAIALVTREPLGVVAAVVPWNFSMLMATWKVAPALAAGNSVVLKPAEQSSLTAIRLVELALGAGVPPGVFNVVTGTGPDVGRAPGLHMDVDGIFFTCSTPVGRIFMEYSARSNLKKIGLELGGKSANIILSSYRDTAHAARTSAHSAFFNQGEMCTCPSRLIVERTIHHEVVETLLEVARDYAPGDPLDPSTSMGALVDHRHTKRGMDFIRTAERDGATIRTGGRQVREDTGGCYVEPVVLTDVTNDMTIAREEVFGPVLSVIAVDDMDKAVRVANDTPFGLASAVWTDDLTTAHKVSAGIRAGLVYVNCYDCDDLTVPFGGFKQSGIGRERSLHALDRYTELKTTWIALG